MASPSTIKVSVNDPFVFSFNLKPETAERSSDVLQKDFEEHNIFFNDEGFHNHIDHHILSIFALGATPKDVERSYTNDSTYQKPSLPVNESIVKRLSNPDEFRKLAGKREHYPNFLQFFKQELEAKGVGPVLQEYVFAGGEFADEMLARLFGGLVHPFIHLGFGIEFKQPAIIAQGLAQTAVHDERLEAFFQPAERKAKNAGKSDKGKTLFQLLDELRGDPDVKSSAKWQDTNKIFDGVMHRAPERMINYASQVTIKPEQMEEKLAELLNVSVYYTAAAQNPKKMIKFDFFHIHAVNSNIFLPTYISQPWMTTETKIRLLEWKARLDLLLYVSRGCSEPRLEDIVSYPPKLEWDGLFHKTVSLEADDGHAAKFVRTVAYGEQLCKPYEEKNGFRVKGDMWLKIGNMLVDSVSGPGPEYVRSAGFEEAWEKVPSRK